MDIYKEDCVVDDLSVVDGDGVDDDGDNRMDWPDDLQCTSASDRNERR